MAWFSLVQWAACRELEFACRCRKQWVGTEKKAPTSPASQALKLLVCPHLGVQLGAAGPAAPFWEKKSHDCRGSDCHVSWWERLWWPSSPAEHWPSLRHCHHWYWRVRQRDSSLPSGWQVITSRAITNVPGCEAGALDGGRSHEQEAKYRKWSFLLHKRPNFKWLYGPYKII